jgi:hypothetical protein
MASSGMLLHMALVRTDVSEELSTSFIISFHTISSQRASVASYN